MSWYQRHTKTDLAARIEELEAAEAERDALKTKLAEAVGVLKDMRDDKIGHRHAVHFRRRAAVFLARHQKETGE